MKAIFFFLEIKELLSSHLSSRCTWRLIKMNRIKWLSRFDSTRLAWALKSSGACADAKVNIWFGLPRVVSDFAFMSLRHLVTHLFHLVGDYELFWRQVFRSSWWYEVHVAVQFTGGSRLTQRHAICVFFIPSLSLYTYICPSKQSFCPPPFVVINSILIKLFFFLNWGSSNGSALLLFGAARSLPWPSYTCHCSN